MLKLVISTIYYALDLQQMHPKHLELLELFFINVGEARNGLAVFNEISAALKYQMWMHVLQGNIIDLEDSSM